MTHAWPAWILCCSQGKSVCCGPGVATITNGRCCWYPFAAPKSHTETAQSGHSGQREKRHGKQLLSSRSNPYLETAVDLLRFMRMIQCSNVVSPAKPVWPVLNEVCNEQVDSTSNSNNNVPEDSEAGDWSAADTNGPKTKSQHSYSKPLPRCR